MEWSYTNDALGVLDHPQFDFPVHDYWTNRCGVRIGYFGRGKGITVLTYNGRDAKFCFNICRTETGDVHPNSDYSGSQCEVFIQLDDFKKYEDDRREKILRDIESFLLIYVCPKFPDEPFISSIKVFS